MLRIAIALVALAACGQPGRSTLPVPPAPPLFASIPADTPYVVASFQAVPLEYWQKIQAAVAPIVERAMVERPQSPVVAAIAAELAGKWNAAGLASLGINPSPRFAVYGLGLEPVVARVEIADEQALLATIQRIASRAGLTLPPQHTLGGRGYWRFDSGDGTMVIALADKQLVVAYGKPARIDATLPLVLGAEKPARNMADGSQLAAVIERDGMGPEMVGYVDTRKLVDEIGAAFGPAPADCMTAIDQLAGRVPGIAVGYREISARRLVGGVVVELAPDLRRALASAKRDVPGLDAVLAGDPVFAMGGGMSLDAMRALGQRAAEAIAGVGEVCHAPVRKLHEIADRLAEKLPAPLDQITGGAMAVEALDMAGDKPRAFDGFSLVAAGSAPALYAELVRELPMLGKLGIAADGTLHEIAAPFPLPFPLQLYAGVGPHALVIAAGPRSHDIAQRALAGHAAKAPLFVASYDYPRLFALAAALSPVGSETDAFTRMLGRATMTMDIDDRGLAIWSDIELR